MPLTATADPGHHHFEADNIYFYMDNGDQSALLQVPHHVILIRSWSARPVLPSFLGTATK